jgi:hypothetical protein
LIPEYNIQKKGKNTKFEKGDWVLGIAAENTQFWDTSSYRAFRFRN